MRSIICRRQAFSLLELMIVLVITGLLAGGVLMGQSLMRSSELRILTQERSQFSIAAKNFREKYSSIPGDMPNATDYWGTNTEGQCLEDSTDIKTRNGNGNGSIEQVPEDFNPVIPTSCHMEGAQFWQHMANAKFIVGQFTGGTETISAPSKYQSAIWDDLSYGNGLAGSSGMFAGDYGNVLIAYVLLPTDELASMDNKVDDGKPGTGMMVILSDTGAISDCTSVSTGTDLTATYHTGATDKLCYPLFRNQF